MEDEFERFGTLVKKCPQCKSAELHSETMPWGEQHGSVKLVMAELTRHCHCCGWEGAEVSGCIGPMIRMKYERKKYLN